MRKALALGLSFCMAATLIGCSSGSGSTTTAAGESAGTESTEAAESAGETSEAVSLDCLLYTSHPSEAGSPGGEDPQ